MSTIVYDFLRSLMLPLSEIDRAIPKQGKIIDLGCGEGVTAKYLARTQTRKVEGVDNNKERLQKSDKSNLIFILSDIREHNLKGADAIIISDVLHHLSYLDQDKLITNIARNLKRGGIFLIKEIDTGEFVRSKLSRFWDFVFYPKDKIYYRNAKDFKNYLQKLGFQVSISRPSRFFPGSTTLLICKKR